MSRPRSRAFTLVELLVVIAIIGILIALLLPAVQAAREAARRTQCNNQVKQLSLALHNYHDTNKAFPMGALMTYAPKAPGSYTKSQQIPWIGRILPYIEQQAIYDKIDFRLYEWWNYANSNRDVAAIEISTLRCPSSDPVRPYTAYAPTNYVACTGSSTSLNQPSSGAIDASMGMFRVVVEDANLTNTPLVITMATIRDGTSNTMALSECLINEPWVKNVQTSGRPECVAGTDAPVTSNDTTPRGSMWMRHAYGQTWGYSSLFPPNDPLHANHECYIGSSGAYYGARSEHPGGVNVGMADGSVRFISETVNLTTWRQISTISGGEVVEGF